MKTHGAAFWSRLAVCLSLLVVPALRGETPAPPAMIMVPQPPPVPSGSYINVFDNSVFDAVGKPPKTDPGEYTSEDYQKWVGACEKQKDVSMQAYRDCFSAKKQESAASIQSGRQRVERLGGRNKPPSPLDEPVRGSKPRDPDSDSEDSE